MGAQEARAPQTQSNFSSLKRNICASRLKLQGEMLSARQKTVQNEDSELSVLLRLLTMPGFQCSC